MAESYAAAVLSNAERAELVKLFSSAIHLHETLAPVRRESTEPFDFPEFMRSKLTFVGGLHSVEQFRDRTPPEVWDAIKDLRGIVAATQLECVTLPDNVIYLAQADLSGPAWRGWRALTANMPENAVFRKWEQEARGSAVENPFSEERRRIEINRAIAHVMWHPPIDELMAAHSGVLFGKKVREALSQCGTAVETIIAFDNGAAELARKLLEAGDELPNSYSAEKEHSLCEMVQRQLDAIARQIVARCKRPGSHLANIETKPDLLRHIDDIRRGVESQLVNRVHDTYQRARALFEAERKSTRFVLRHPPASFTDGRCVGQRPPKKRGRPKDPFTEQRATFVHEHRDLETYGERLNEYLKEHPNDPNATEDKLRLAYEREFPQPRLSDTNRRKSKRTSLARTRNKR